MRAAWMAMAIGCMPGTSTDAPSDVDTGDGVVVDGVTVEASGVFVCDAPEERAEKGPFALVTAKAQPLPRPWYRLVGGAVVLADLDADGLDDVFLPGWDAHQLHIATEPGVFDEQAAERLPAGTDLSYAAGATAVDVDDDGDLDLFVARWDLPDVLLLNDGTGHFVDGTRGSGLGGFARSQASAWGDMDGDGDLDLFVGNYGIKPEEAFATEDFTIADDSRLYENLGGGRFADRSETLPRDLHQGYTFMASWQDLDGDRRPELIVVNDFGWARPSRILWNRPEGLVPDDGSSGFSIPFAGMGLAIGDVNGDGVPDFAQTSWKESSLLVSIGERQWADAAQARGFWPAFDDKDEDIDDPLDRNQIFGWGVHLVDLDLDGDLDLPAVYGTWDEWTEKPTMQDALFVDEDGRYVDRARDWGFDDEGAGRGLAVGDLDRDGWPDLVERVLDAPTRMYLSRCGEGTWLTVRLSQPERVNPFAIGARVVVTTGETTQVRWTRAGGTGMYGSDPVDEVRFGLAGAEQVDRVEITWPDGGVSVLEDVEARQHLRVVRSAP